MSSMPSQDAALPLAAADQPVARDWKTPLELCVLGAIWGASFMFQRIAAPEFGTTAMAELRLAFGALVLLPFLWKHFSAIEARLWPKLVAIGAVNSALPFALFAFASQHAPAGIVAITNATTVLFATLMGFAFFGDRIGWRRTVAVLAGFAGVVVLTGGNAAGGSLDLAVLAGCSAAAMYGVSVHLLKRYLTGLPPAAVAAATTASAALLMLPFAIAQWPSEPVSGAAWFSAAMTGVICTGLAYALYYRLVQRVGPSRSVVVTYLVPLFAVGWAWWLLDEPLTLTMGLAGALILGSVAFSQKAGK